MGIVNIDDNPYDQIRKASAVSLQVDQRASGL